ncbi:MAG: cytochrome b561 [Rhodanobacter sp.]|nr:cytochrome b561 [Rhodanobacter sp.]
MTWKNTTDRYGALTIGLHWLMLLLLAAVYAAIELRGIFPKGSAENDAMKTWHFMLGLSVLVLAVLRLCVRLSAPTPRIVPTPPLWQTRLAGLVHIALYVLMIGLPLAGWLMLSASGKPVPFFGLQLPMLLDANKELAGQIKEVHETVATAGYFIIGLHALAALFHHYIARDNTLLRMLPSHGKGATTMR